MLRINDKTFMNLQEAVQWLLENNALPFQSTANYVGNTEIAMSTLVNPSPAKVRVGSLIFFADSKVSTVIGVTSNSFIVSDQYNDLVDDVVYVSNVAINGSGHLICTLSNGDTIDAGNIKQVSNFSIDGSQHLIANYNDGTTTDLGAIFSGNVNISGNLTANSIIENMAGYSWWKNGTWFDTIYAGAVKNGNKITFVLFAYFTKDASTPDQPTLGGFVIPSSVGSKLYPYTGNVLVNNTVALFHGDTEFYVKPYFVKKPDNGNILIEMRDVVANLTNNDTYYFRMEFTFLLSDPLNS